MCPGKGDRQAHKELAGKAKWRNFADDAAKSHCSMPEERFEAGLQLSDPEKKAGRPSGGDAGKLRGGGGRGNEIWEINPQRLVTTRIRERQRCLRRNKPSPAWSTQNYRQKEEVVKRMGPGARWLRFKH